MSRAALRLRLTVVLASVALLGVVLTTASLAQGIVGDVVAREPVNLWQVIALFPSVGATAWLLVKAYELGKRTQGGENGEVVSIKETLRRLEVSLAGLPIALNAISDGQNVLIRLLRDHEETSRAAREAVMALKDRDDMRHRRHDDAH